MSSRTKTSRTQPPTARANRRPRSYTPLSDALSQPLTFADTELSEGLQRHSLVALLSAAISRKRRSDGEPLSNLLCALLVWPLMKVKSLHCFCSELCQILAGFAAVYVLADAWFGCKENIACCLANQLTGIFQMKRGLLAYRYHGHAYTAYQLYVRVQRRMRPANRRARFKTASLVVSLNLETENRQSARWVEVRLVFSAPVRASSADTWVVFLCTDVKLSDAKVLAKDI